MWFAFKLCSLYIWLQHNPKYSPRSYRCDLLSNFALCTFDYNRLFVAYRWCIVVICFQTLLFVHLITTDALIWFLPFSCDLLSNFALCTFDYNIELSESTIYRSCDLLSNFALCTFDYNDILLPDPESKVVICFQTLLFVHLITTCP